MNLVCLTLLQQIYTPCCGHQQTCCCLLYYPYQPSFFKNVLFRNHPSFSCYALACVPNMTTATCCFRFKQNTICGILVGWSCSGDWKPITLYDGKSFWFSGLRKSWSFRSFQRWCLQATPCDWSTKVALVFTSMLWMHWSWWTHTMTRSKWLLPRCGERPGKSAYVFSIQNLKNEYDHKYF